MDRRLRFAAAATLATALSVACSPRDATPQTSKAPVAAADTEVVAEIDGKPVTAGELDAWIREDLYQREVANKGKTELFELRSEALDRMIDENLLAAEAGRRKLSVDDLLASEAKTSDEISDEAVKAFYEQNKARMGGATLEQIGPRIRRFLEERQSADAREQYVRSLRDKAGVSVRLTAPRVEVAAEGPSRGPANAPITIVEFSDYECPFCKRAEPILKQVLERYPDKIRLVYRNFPLEQMHPRARPTAEAALCAEEQGKFWEFHEKVFSGSGLQEADLVGYADAVGLDTAKFKACMAERRYKDRVDADAQAGRDAGVSGTPAFFVNGIMLSGAKPVEEFSAIIERELDARGKAAAGS
ncbi:MAG: thioredoxin domain-containing protein [Deltaproteobacteria bacterium]|nr:thioredoxin domain-containing protein [Deltaproteobacteria bacterium]